jgi:stage V sporulation protein S
MVSKVAQVSNKTVPGKLGGYIAMEIRDGRKVELHAIGAGSVNQAMKAVAVARGFVAPNGIDLVCIPAFQDGTIEGEERTVMRFLVEPR